ncbi:MAG TPA: hypothetical protein VN962_17420 [Polyangia bacterium]|nr:hypothetical protein [Polyangia bacterium]
MSGPSCWTPLGPACVLDFARSGAVATGPFRALAFDPNDATGRTIYAAAASGGVWKSADEGLTWTPIGDAISTTSVGVLAVGSTPDLSNTVLLAGTGDVQPIEGLPGQGPAISRDGGAHWDNVQTLPGPVLVQHPRFHAAAMVSGLSEQMWLATDSGLLWASGGQSSWQAAVRANGTPLTIPWTAVVISEGAVLAAASGQGTSLAADGVYRIPLDDSTPKAATLIAGTPDALPASGSSWQIALAVAPSDRRVVYAAFMNIAGVVNDLFRSSDGGLTWNRRNPPLGVGFRNTDQPFQLVVHPADPDRLYLLTMHVACSFDGGTTAEGWEQVASEQHVLPCALAFSPVAPYHAWLATDEGLFFSSSEGTRVRGGEAATWQARNRGLAALSLNSVAQHPSERSILVAAGVDRGVLRYRNHPLWETVAMERTARVAIDALAPLTWYATGFFSSIVRQSKDGGKKWTTLSKGLGTSDPLGVCPLALDPSNRGVAYFGTVHVYRRDDAQPALGWVKIASPTRTLTIGSDTSTSVSPLSAITVAPSDPNTIYVGTESGALFRLALNGATKTWDVFSPKTPPSGNVLSGVSSIAVSFQDPRTVYATFGTPQLAVRNGDHVGVDNRLWRSDDGGDTWTPVPIPVSGADVFFHKVIVHPDDHQRVYVGTDRYVFAAGPDADFSQLWHDVTDNLPRTPVADLLIFPPAPAGPGQPPERVLRAATFGRGVWERPLADIDAGQPATVCLGTDVYVRDSLVDAGRGPTPPDVEDPLRAGKHLKPGDAIDLKVQRLDEDNEDGEDGDEKSFAAFASNVQYLPADDATADPDFIGFQLFRRDAVHAGQETHVFLQAHNRGPAPVTMSARVLFAPASVDAPLPANPFGNIAATEAWQPIGDRLETEVRPAEPTVFVWRAWQAPAELKDHVKLVGVVATIDEPLTMAASTIEQLAPANKQVLFRNSQVIPIETGFFRWWMIPVALGAAAGITAAVVYRGDISSFFRTLLGGGRKEPQDR